MVLVALVLAVLVLVVLALVVLVLVVLALVVLVVCNLHYHCRHHSHYPRLLVAVVAHPPLK